MDTKFFRPRFTTQYPICPVPFKMDTYQGCVASCNYCFARSMTEQHRRAEPVEKQKFTHLVGADVGKFKRWFKKAYEEGYNHERGETVAIAERLPIKIGAVADPFPPIEFRKRITYRVLRELDRYDYPLQVQTKFPHILASYCSDFDNPNWAISVTLISLDDKFVHTCEPGAPTPKQRLAAVEKLAAQGHRVMCKIQPAIYPKVLSDLPDLVRGFKDHGCWAFNTEGLKIRIVMPKKEQKVFERIGKYGTSDEFEGLGIRNFYRLRGINTGADYEIDYYYRRKYTDLAADLAAKHGLKYFSADNFMGKVGDGCECCGTQALRDYKIWGYNHRTRYWGKLPHESEQLRDVVINEFAYSGDPRRYKTLGEVMDKELSRKNGELDL